MTTRQENDITSIDVNKHSGVLINWFAVIADQDQIYSGIRE